jgi:spore germination protein KC
VTLTGGCWDRLEINDVALIQTAAIDWLPGDRVRLGLEIAVPTAFPGGGVTGGPGRKPSFVVVAEAATLGEALNDLQQTIPRRLFWGHNQAVIVGEAAARSGISPHLSFFDRHREPRPRTLLCITPGEALPLLQTRLVLEPTVGQKLRELAPFSMVADAQFYRFDTRLNDEGIDPVAIRVEARKTLRPGGDDTEEAVEMTGLAAFQKDRLVGWLDRQETDGALWLTGQHRSVLKMIPLALPEAGTGRPARASVEVFRSQTSLKPSMESGRLVVTARISVEAQLMETMGPVDLTRPQVVRQLEYSLAKTIAESAWRALGRARAMQTDVFGLGQSVHRSLPGVWQRLKPRWREVLPTVPVRLELDVKIRRTGKANKPLEFPESEFRQMQDGKG